MKKDRAIGIGAGDCGEPREIEYANEEEWPPNSRQVLYYFSAMGSHFGHPRSVEEEGEREREEEEERQVANESLPSSGAKSLGETVAGMSRDE